MGAADRRRRRPGDVYESAVEQYAAHLESTITHPLVGLKVVLDCAEGAAYEAGPRALEDAGATVIAIHADPDGLNINDNCGSTHMESLRAAVVEHGRTPASPSTATPTAAWPSTTRATSSTATRSSRSSPSRCSSRAGWPRTPSSRR